MSRSADLSEWGRCDQTVRRTKKYIRRIKAWLRLCTWVLFSCQQPYMGQSLNEVSLHDLGDFTKGTRKVLGSVAQQLHEMCLRLQWGSIHRLTISHRSNNCRNQIYSEDYIDDDKTQHVERQRLIESNPEFKNQSLQESKIIRRGVARIESVWESLCRSDVRTGLS